MILKRYSLFCVYDIKTFTHWLYEYYPDHTDFSKLDRDIIEDYFGWLRIESGFTGHQINSCILNLKKFFEDGLLLEYDYFPTKPLVLITDYRFRKVTKAEFYSDEEMKRINKILPEIPTVYAIIIFCLEVLALRISDLVSLTPDMIEIVSNEEKDAGLYKYQLKTNNSISIYLVDSVHTLLMDQYEYSKETYGENVKYIFANGKDSYMAPGSINTEVNKLFYKHKVMGDNGKILRFRSHKFRATKATQLISSGFGAMEGKKALGHSGLQSLSYYANVSTDVVIDSLEPFINKAQTLIENIGKVQNINPDDFKNALPLCNGWCCRPASLGICEHANYCLSCNLFKPDIRHKNYYNIQLLELEATLELAKNSENELLEKKTLKDIKNIKKIIAKVDELCQQKT